MYIYRCKKTDKTDACIICNYVTQPEKIISTGENHLQIFPSCNSKDNSKVDDMNLSIPTKFTTVKTVENCPKQAISRSVVKTLYEPQKVKHDFRYIYSPSSDTSTDVILLSGVLTLEQKPKQAQYVNILKCNGGKDTCHSTDNVEMRSFHREGNSLSNSESDACYKNRKKYYETLI